MQGPDSVIIVGGDTLLVADICQIKVKPPAFLIAGSALAISGLGILGGGAIMFFAMDNIIIQLLGVFVSAVGISLKTTGTIMTTFGQKYKTDQWEIIVNEVSSDKNINNTIP